MLVQQETIIAFLVDNLPALDIRWPENLQERWFTAFEALFNLIIAWEGNDVSEGL
jgi:hypothetical protein